MKSSRGAVLMVGAEGAPLVIVVAGATFFGPGPGEGATTTLSGEGCSAGSTPVSPGRGFADVIVVADVGVIVGETTGGGGSDDDGGVCGVARTAIVTPKSIIPTTATIHVIVARNFVRRGTSTVARSWGPLSSRRDDGGGASGMGALRPE